MKKSILSLALASVVLFACGDDKGAEVNQAAEQATKKVEQKAIDTTKAVEKEVKKVVSGNSAERAETVFKTLTEGTQTYYNKIMKMQPMVKSFKYELVSYEKGDNESKAVTKGVLDLNTKEKAHHELTFNHVIKHGDVVNITSTINKPTEIGEEAQILFDNFSYVTDVNADDSFVQVVTLKPINVDCADEQFKCKESDLNKLGIKGFNLITKSTLEKIKGGFGDFTGKFDGVTVDDKESGIINLNPFEFEGFYKENFEYAFNSTPVSLEGPDFSAKIEKLTSSGTYELREDLGIALGKQVGSISNIEITSADLPTPIKLKSIDYTNDATLNDGLLAAKGNMTMTPEGEAMKQLTQGMLNVKDAKFGYSMSNLKAETMAKYQDLMREMMMAQAESEEQSDEESDESTDETSDDLSEEMETKMNAEGQAIFDSLKSTGAKMGFDANVNADEGNIALNANFDVLKDSTITFEQLQNLSDPKAILQAINISADASVPATLLEAIAGPNIMMVGMFMQKDGDVYKSKVTTEKGQLMINGVPAPF